MQTVTFDLETRGFHTDDPITVVGFGMPFGDRLFLNTGGRSPPSELESTLDAKRNEPVVLSTLETETAVLEAGRTFAAEKITPRDDVKIAAFNGETWKGGFDLPHLRTRSHLCGVEWFFDDVPFVDTMAVFQKRFNLEETDLVTVYEQLIGGWLTDLDPFENSAEAVPAWEEGNFEALLLHNLADIRRTMALTRLAERYCSGSDFSMKNLDPVA